MHPKSVEIQLQAGASAGTIGDNRVIDADGTHHISFLEFQRLSLSALQNDVDIVGFSEVPVNEKGINFTEVNASLANLVGTRVGQVEHGTAPNDTFTLVQNVGAAATAAGDVVRWVDNGRTINRDRAADTGFAGVALAAIPVNGYGWIQIDGSVANVNFGAGVASGDLIALDPTTAGQARTAQVGDDPFGVALETGAESIGGAGDAVADAVIRRPGRRRFRTRF